MKNYDVVLFDLDGTITDPGTGITNSVAFALKRFGIDEEDNKTLYKFIGPPLIDSFMEYYGFDYEKAKTAVEYYREYYSVKGIFENAVYDGIPEMLERLENSGKMIVLATSKPDVFAKQILDHFNLSKYFDFVAGATMDETRTDKADVISYALETLKIDDTEKVIMVGDRSYDIVGAKKNKLDSAGVLFGYGSREELYNSNPTYIAESVEKLSEILL